MGFCMFTCHPNESMSVTPSACSGIGSSTSAVSIPMPLAASSAADANTRAAGQSAWRCARRASSGSTSATTSTSGLPV